MRAKKHVSLKRKVVHYTKTVCTTCQTYASSCQNNNCSKCGKNTVRTVGSAFRLPKKGTWSNELIGLINSGPPPSYGILFGKNHASGKSFQKGPRAPRQMRERAVIAGYTKNNNMVMSQEFLSPLGKAKRLLDRFTKTTNTLEFFCESSLVDIAS